MKLHDIPWLTNPRTEVHTKKKNSKFPPQAMEHIMQLGSFMPKAVQGLYSFDHYEAPNGMWIQLRANLRPIGKGNEAVFSYGANDPRPHVRFDRWEDLVVFVEAL